VPAGLKACPTYDLHALSMVAVLVFIHRGTQLVATAQQSLEPQSSVIVFSNSVGRTEN
jgi:hypothetical protein